MSPTESFLRYLTLPEDEYEFVELQHSAVILISHLDRLAAPYLPLSTNQKVTPLFVFCFVFSASDFRMSNVMRMT